MTNLKSGVRTPEFDIFGAIDLNFVRNDDFLVAQLEKFRYVEENRNDNQGSHIKPGRGLKSFSFCRCSLRTTSEKLEHSFLDQCIPDFDLFTATTNSIKKDFKNLSQKVERR